MSPETINVLALGVSQDTHPPTTMPTTKPHNISRLWRPSRSVMRGSNWYAERNPRNRAGIEGPYRQPGYPVAWWLAMFAAAMGAIVLTWWPAAPL